MPSSPPQLCLVLGLTINSVYSFRLITSSTGSGTTYSDVVGDYQQNGTNAGTDQTVTHWYDPNDGAYDELGDKTSTLPGANGTMWGWWSRWGSSSGAEDPLRKMSYVFACSSPGTITISFDVYFCITNWDTNATWFAYDRTSLHDGQNIIQADYSTNWTAYSTVDIDNGNGACSETVRYRSFTDTFATGGYQNGQTSSTTGLPPDLVTISINHNMEGYGRSTTPNTRNVVGFNNMKFTCTQIGTDAPTQKEQAWWPTQPTGGPTRMPTIDPTDNPTEKPSPVPSANNVPGWVMLLKVIGGILGTAGCGSCVVAIYKGIMKNDDDDKTRYGQVSDNHSVNTDNRITVSGNTGNTNVTFGKKPI